MTLANIPRVLVKIKQNEYIPRTPYSGSLTSPGPMPMMKTQVTIYTWNKPKPNLLIEVPGKM